MKNNPSRGGFGRHKALGVVADLWTVSMRWKCVRGLPLEPKGPWILVPAYRARHLQACPLGQPASCLQGLLLWGRAALGLPSPSTASTSQLVCTAALLPGASLWLLSNQWFELQRGNVPWPFVKMWFNLSSSNGCSLLNTQGRLSLLRYMFTKDD